MNTRSRFLARAALIAALYTTLTHLQNLLIPGSASWAIQFRASEAMCILAFFTPAAIPGLTIGCFLFNLTFSAALPLDWLLGSAATLLSTGSMWLLRNFRFRNYPLVGLVMPAFFNSLLVGWELCIYVGSNFWLNAVYVAIGELFVMFTLGNLLYFSIKKRHLDARLF